MEQQLKNDEKDMRWWIDQGRKQLARLKDINSELDKQIAESKDNEDNRDN